VSRDHRACLKGESAELRDARWKGSAWRKHCGAKTEDAAGDGRWSATNYGEYDESRENFATPSPPGTIFLGEINGQVGARVSRARQERNAFGRSQDAFLEIDKNKAVSCARIPRRLDEAAWNSSACLDDSFKHME